MASGGGGFERKWYRPLSEFIFFLAPNCFPTRATMAGNVARLVFERNEEADLNTELRMPQAHVARAAERQGRSSMPRISINEMTTYHWSFDEDVTHYETIGVGGVGVWRRKLTEFGDERGIEMLRDSRLMVSSLACAGGFTGSDGQTFREAVDDALDAVHLAAEMKAACLIVVTGARAGHTANHARRLASEALKELGDAGAALGVQIAVQPMHRQPFGRWTFLTSLAETLDLLGRCRHPQVGLVFDVVQFWNEASTDRKLSEIVPLIKMVGLSDIRTTGRDRAENAPSGESVPLSEMVRRLEEAGYRGWYDLQILCEKSWMSDYARLLADCCRTLEAACPQLFADGDETPPAFAAPHSGEGAGALRFADEPAPPY
jgi:sugar phosphate isomerase/epimerase